MSASLKGTKICFTGTFPGFTRAELEGMADEYGFTFQNTITRATNILVAAEDAGEVKLKKARDYGVKIWKPDDFLLMLGADDADGVAPPKGKKVLETAEDERNREAYYAKQDDVGCF